MGAFEGGRAVITGGGMGIGAAIALALAAEKAGLCLIGRRLEPLEAVAARARHFGVEATCYQADLATESGQAKLIERLMSELSRVDVLIQNAAMYLSGSIERSRLEDFDNQYRTNMRAP